MLPLGQLFPFSGSQCLWYSDYRILGGLVAVALVAMMNRLVSRRSHSIVNLILCGMLVSSLFNALVSFTKFVADTETKLPAITFWLMGSLSSVKLTDLRVCYIFARNGVAVSSALESEYIIAGRRRSPDAGCQRGFYRGSDHRLRNFADVSFG